MYNIRYKGTIKGLIDHLKDLSQDTLHIPIPHTHILLKAPRGSYEIHGEDSIIAFDIKEKD